MKRLISILVFVLLASLTTLSFAATQADYFNGFEGGTNGDTVTTSALAAGQKGTGGTYQISKTPMTGYAFKTAGQLSSSRGFTVNGANYDLTGSLGYAADMNQTSANHAYFTYNFPSSYDNVAVGFMWKPPNLSEYDPWGSYTVACVYSSGGYYNCLGMIGYGTPYAGTKYKAGIEAQDVGEPFVIDAGTTYWVTINWVRNGTSVVRFYNSSTFELLATSSYTNVNAAASKIFIGRPDAHSGETPYDMYFDNLAIKYNSTDPLLPSEMEPPQTAFYVDKDSIGGTCNDTNSGTITSPWCTLSKANTSAVAGNSIHIRAGTYTTSYINPSNSGTSDSPITFAAYGSESVIISGTNYGVYINGKDYIKVRGIRSTLAAVAGLVIWGGDHNEIDSCTFDNVTTSQYTSNYLQSGAQYNWIHNSTFLGNWTCNGNFGEVLQVGTEASDTTDQSYYNLIENNVLAYAGHHVLGIKSRYNTIRNNYIHNEIQNGKAGGRNLYLSGAANYSGYNLIEGNRLGYAGQPCAYDVVGSVAISTPYNILRYNMSYYNNAYWLGFTQYTNFGIGSNNHVYNNTAYGNGKALIKTGYASTSQDTAVYFDTNATSAIGNVLKNNLYYNHYQIHSGLTTGQTIGTNYNGDVSGNPLFIDISYIDKTVSTTPNLALQAGSPVINEAVALTTVAVADSGTGTTLIVTDSAYFQDGSWAPAGKIQADWIAVGTVGNTVQISSINYSTNTITLSSSISRNDGDSIWLFKNSSGTTILSGIAPDFGANEYSGDVVTYPVHKVGSGSLLRLGVGSLHKCQ